MFEIKDICTSMLFSEGMHFLFPFEVGRAYLEFIDSHHQVQKNNYAAFYDDQSQMWSICFDTSSSASEFGKWVSLYSTSIVTFVF